MDIKHEDMTLGLYVDNIRIGISNLNLEFKNFDLDFKKRLALESLSRSYADLFQFITDCGLKDIKRP